MPRPPSTGASSTRSPADTATPNEALPRFVSAQSAAPPISADTNSSSPRFVSAQIAEPPISADTNLIGQHVVVGIARRDGQAVLCASCRSPSPKTTAPSPTPCRTSSTSTSPAARRPVRSSKRQTSRIPPSTAKLAELGWLGLHVPEEFGGSGYTLEELVVVVEELGRGLAPGPFVPTVVASAVHHRRRLRRDEGDVAARPCRRIDQRRGRDRWLCGGPATERSTDRAGRSSAPGWLT